MLRISAQTKTPKAFDDLNVAQRLAVDHGDEPLLVIAGAGSGKTKTLTCRVARLLQDGIDPHRILLLTFSRRAATDMIKRVGAAARAPGATSDVVLPWSGTFHAIGARLLRELAPVIGLSPAFTIHDRGDSTDLMGMVRHDLGFGTDAKRFPMKGTCLAIYSRCVNSEETLADVLAVDFSWCRAWEGELRQMFCAYVEAKQNQQILDYDDLLLYWRDLMELPELAAEVASKFDHVLVDEYQDTNRLQSRILLRLKPDGRGLTVVGDDAQSIYAFRAATVRNILDFPASFSPPARIVTLEQNYRSTQAILDASNAVIDRATERFTKNLRTDRTAGSKPYLVNVRDEAEQAVYVAEQILDARERGTQLINQAVLFRAADHSALVELELHRRDIPFVKFGGLKFLEAAHIKDVIAILRWGQNPSDRLSGFRALQLLAGMGPAKAARVLEHAANGTLPTGAPPGVAAAEWDGLCALLNDMHHNRSWPTLLEHVAQWYVPFLEVRYEDSAARTADIKQLVHIGSTYPSHEAFLTDLVLDPPNATSAEAGPPRRDDDYLILSTIHSAKGQEWRNVFVLNAVDGCIPSDLGTGSTPEIEEERRLLYVAMTRAKDDLHVIVPQRFYVQQQSRQGDRNVFAARTRFIPADILDRFEIRTAGGSDRAQSASKTAAIAPVDLASRARERWA